MHKGVCIGGPLAGLTITSRSEVGLVAVDRPASAAWVYRIDAGGRFILDTSDDPSRIDEDGTRALDAERALDAGREQCLDVIAVPGDGRPDPDDQDPETGELVRISADLIVAEDDPDEVRD